jgi:hypothetical protein
MVPTPLSSKLDSLKQDKKLMNSFNHPDENLDMTRRDFTNMATGMGLVAFLHQAFNSPHSNNIDTKKLSITLATKIQNAVELLRNGDSKKHWRY